MPVADTFGRRLRALRISVTDRCNLRCEYCMPEDTYSWLSRGDLLTFAEMDALVDVFKGLGVEKVRLTGGEPLLRPHLEDLVARLAAKPGLSEIALTTNGVLLAECAARLRRAGLHRVNVSLDTLQPDRFRALTRQDTHARVLEGIEEACRLFPGTKIDAVITRGVNDTELADLLEYGSRVGAEVRFIEYMDVGGATHWKLEQVLSRREMITRLASHYGGVEPVDEPGSTAPADRFRLPDGRVFGIISSTTEPFCRSCDRARLTADGIFYTCLYATDGLSLRQPLRNRAAGVDLAAMIESRWRPRTDRSAEVRRDLRDRAVFLPLARLRADPHLEMHNRGG